MAILPALMPVIKSVDVTSTEALVIPVPSGYEILFLEWHDVYGDQTSVQNLLMTLVSGDNGYDNSLQTMGAVSSTSNDSNSIQLGSFGDTTGQQRYDSGQVVIFNRASQEKVVLGTEAFYRGDSEDSTANHIEGKDRDTTDPITTITITAQTGNMVSGRIILRGLRTDKAPRLGSPDIMQFIGSHEVSGTEASVTFPTIPTGYGMLMLFFHGLEGDTTGNENTKLTFNGDTDNNYDRALQQYGSASSTAYGSAYAGIAIMGDSDDRELFTSGFMTIFNRAGQEKVVIGSSNYFSQTNMAGTIHDFAASHVLCKWRNTATEINTLTLTPTADNWDAGKVWLIGVRI